jgi:tetratricopeptide (TPR) repeat protein
MITVGLANLERGDPDTALQLFALASRSDDPAILAALGQIYAALGDHDQAESCLQRAALGGSAEAMQLLAALPGTRARPGGAGRGPALDPRDPLGNADRLRDAYKRTGDPETLRLAIEAARQAVASHQAAGTGRAAALASLGVLLRLDYERDRDPRRLDESVETGRAAVAAGSPSDAGYPAALSSLGNALQEQFKLTEDPALLDEAAGLYRTATELLPPGHPELAGQFSNLGNALLARATHGRDPALLDEAILAGRAALRAGAPGTPANPVQQANLASALLMRFEYSHNMVQLHEAVDLFREALAALPAGHVGRRAVETNLTVATDILRLAQDAAGPADEPPGSGARGDADAAGDDGRDADLWGRDADLWGKAAIDRASNLIAMYERTGDQPRLTESIRLLRSLLTHERLTAATRQGALHHLGTALWSLFERTGELATLDEAAGLLESAMEISGAPQEARLSSKSNLAKVLTLRAQYSGAESDLQRSIELCREVVAATAQTDPWRAGRLSALAAGLYNLGGRLWDSGLLRESVSAERAALAACPADGSDRAASSSNLGLYVITWSDVSDDPAGLGEAVDLCRAAVVATAPDHPLYPRFQANLGQALVASYRAGRGDRDLDEAAAVARSAVAATPGGHPNRTERLSLFAEILEARYRSRPDPVLLDELITAAQSAAAATTEGHRQWAAATVLLARSQALRAFGAGDSGQLSVAMAGFHAVATSDHARIGDRIAAAERWADCLLAAGDLNGALQPLTLAVSLLPRAARPSLARADQELPLSLFAGLASSAAACALAAGDQALAVQLLEHGRGVLLGRALDARGDLSILRERHPDLAAGFERLRDLLDLDPTMVAEPERRHALATEWDALLADIRNRPGFEGFLQAPGLDELTARCAAGPVVIVNVSRLRCDALILRADGLSVVPLPGVTQEDVTTRAEAFRADVPAAWRPGAAADRVAATLAWLWDEIAEPVLDALGLGPAAAGGDGRTPWPRLWWVPTGPLAFLPLHAAGHHDDAGVTPSRTVLDRAVCSYLPTVRSLPSRASNAAGDPADRAAPEVLAVVMPSTPSAADLPGAQGEAEYIASRLADVDILSGGEATHAAVLAALPSHPWVHFACHAASSTDDASAGRLLLVDHEDHPLTVREIAGLQIPGAELAYLSACDTARGPVKLADEAVHVTGAFHMAGYAHVIGTLWSVADDVAVEVARDVYASLTSSRPDAAAAALALHDAIRNIRAGRPGRPALWAAHVHVGP